ncbi:hypothetical protein VCSRO9_3424 [Vibrio cholerae]|nr:hypothetical protein VCSRO56_0358 [Vibrio cholerae]GIA25684.1 hypothetical protein VCSRO179_3394 [Vibrio cholerae]GIB05594.1 hypothetical protein VCSRO9_3424 [Vibrio cholerae]
MRPKILLMLNFFYSNLQHDRLMAVVHKLYISAFARQSNDKLHRCDQEKPSLHSGLLGGNRVRKNCMETALVGSITFYFIVTNKV